MLFKLDTIDNSSKIEKSTSSKIIRKKLNKKKKIGKENAKVADVIGKIEKDYLLSFVTAGEWSTHNLLYHILNQIGPSSVSIISWTISNPALEYLMNIIKKGLILDLKLIFDWRVKLGCRNLDAILKHNNIEVRYMNSHAKMMVIKNDKYYITVISSANLTNNPRLESGVIIEDKDIYNFNLDWITKEFNNGNPFNIEKKKKKVKK